MSLQLMLAPVPTRLFGSRLLVGESCRSERVAGKRMLTHSPDIMFPFAVFSSETSPADLLQQVRGRDGLQCPRCRSESAIKYGSCRAYQRYRCKDCGRTFNDKTGTIFAHAKISLNKLLFAVYTFLRFNTSIRQCRG